MPPLLGRSEGRRHLVWLMLFLSGAVLAGPRQPKPAQALPPDTAAPAAVTPEAIALAAARTLLRDRWDEWTTKERRVAIRGAALLADVAAGLGLDTGSDLACFLAERVDAWLAQPPLSGQAWTWRMKSALERAGAALAGWGVLGPAGFQARWAAQRVRDAMLGTAYETLLDQVLGEVDPPPWQSLRRVAGLDHRRRLWLESHLRAAAPRLWAAAAQDSDLLLELADIFLDQKDPAAFPPESPARLSEHLQAYLARAPSNWTREAAEHRLRRLAILTAPSSDPVRERQ